MPNYSPNMNLPVPIVGVNTGPTWATLLDQCMTVIDGHTHTSGSGVPITSAAISINADLPANNYSLTGLLSTSYQAQSTDPAIQSVYVKGVDLYYRDGNGTAIQITTSGAVNATSSGISSGTASAAFVAGNLTVLADTGVPANIYGASLYVQYPGSYPTPAGNGVVIECPSTIASQYSLVLPVALPSANNSFLTMSTAGVMGNSITVDGSTIVISSNQIKVPTSGIGTSQIADSAITTAKIADSAVTTAKINALAVTAAKIANSTITGTQLSSSINLPGAGVQSASKNVIVSNTNPSPSSLGLSVIRGRVQSDGTVIGGEGFSVNRTGVGVYSITWSSAFNSGDVPAVCITSLVATAGIVFSAVASNNTGCTVRAYTGNLSGFSWDATDAPFNIIAIGQRAS